MQTETKAKHTPKYTVESASQWGAGVGPNGTGKRAKVSGFFVVNPDGRRVRAFTGKTAETQANDWAVHCNEHMLPNRAAIAKAEG